ncbi:putative beta-glucosidase [Rosa chinensis]|uniref:Putative beta-glucosidase n=1 Tax=Rosa chinensis TaxID=74649 RepID=A0A2P6QM64_ROSCH|nr:beta-glucosidase 12 [Rosa chinensis]PRQ35254.1 putative beta-glucosidase [Rosa chinensis]
MAFRLGITLLLVLVCTAVTSSRAANSRHRDTSSLHRSSFPAGFVFGTASSAYQYEGAANEGGRGPSIWDTYTRKYPEKIHDHSTGDVAIDEYHRYKEDIRIMKDMGLDAYRFSISWSRLLPNGKLSGCVNKEGIKYYNNLINELLANGLVPYVTLFHWDTPQALEDEYGGFLSPKIVDHFKDYANLCYKEFGDRVKHWITLNEPWSYSNGGYVIGTFAPNRCSDWPNLNCTGGDSGTEPYLASHYQLLAHAAAVKLYRDKYQASRKGVIGITLLSYWFVPYSDAKWDVDAAERALDFMYGWFMDPLINGDYPHSMRYLVADRLPKFTKEESKLLKGSFDFIGVNYYTANFAAYKAPCFNAAHPNAHNPSYTTDALVNLSVERDGVPIGPKTALDWLYIYPEGFRELLLYTKNKYNDPVIYITENGVNELNDPGLSLEEALTDNHRIDYYDAHLSYLLSAIKDGVKVKGYFAWSLFDNFEWNTGYTCRFGLNFIDYKNGLERYPKLSAGWFKKFLQKCVELDAISSRKFQSM